MSNDRYKEDTLVSLPDYYVGIDIGSTTTKIAVADARTEELLYSDYRRHHARQRVSVKTALELLEEHFPGAKVQVALTGSGSKYIAESLEVPFIQEVVANSVALRRHYQDVGTAIELGGQDAKIIFFHKDEQGTINVSDMRMNGSCAGGTGAFIDEVASILKVPVEQFNDLAEQGRTVYDISGRCGVYAKTDIQPLLNQGIAKADLALSAFHAIAKQTIGGLAQGLDILPPVVFEGGPLTFNPALIRVFSERLHLTPEQTLIPRQPEIMIAYGAALSIPKMFADEHRLFTAKELLARIEAQLQSGVIEEGQHAEPFFHNKEELQAFRERHKLASQNFPAPGAGETIRAFLGIDSGSTTTKFVLLNEAGDVIDSFYANNEGDPLMVAKHALIAMRDKYRSAGARLEILSAGSTGYGELLFNKAMGTDYHVVETVAHARAAAKYVDDATFILDIGGQDMKAIWIDNGIITNIVVNEACSSGCGSFLENFAKTLSIPVEEIADNAFRSENPATLGSRCTVFMNSSIITEQRNGKQPADIMAGLCRSIIENVFTKVIRLSNVNSLGDKIVVQGGTFRNDAVLRAMEQYTGREVIRAPYPGLMGAIGVGLLVRERYLAAMKKTQDSSVLNAISSKLDPNKHNKGWKSTFIGLDDLDDFTYTRESNSPCPFCGNHCRRTIVRFSNGNSWITNNRCERGEVLGDPKDEKVREKLMTKNRKRDNTPNMFALRQKLLMADYDAPRLLPDQNMTIGIPRVLSFWETMPFWTTFWKSLGFKVCVSPLSSRTIYEDGLQAVTSDTVCFPAKLVHGHLRWLHAAGVDRIFMPSITTVKSENTEKTSESMCAIVKGYPIVIRNSDNPERSWGLKFEAPLFHWHEPEDRDRQLTIWMQDHYGIEPDVTRRAMAAGDAAQDSFSRQLKEAGRKIVADVEREGKYAVILASRPYQNDPLVNHDLPDMFTSLGIPVLTVDSLGEVTREDLHNSRIDIVNNYHARMLGAAALAAQKECLEYVQIVSFGCGHDAYLSDEIVRMMKEISGKTPLVLKLDESDIQGPLRIRVRSFIETVNMNRLSGREHMVRDLADPYPVKFTRKDRKSRTVLVPNTSHAFSQIMAAAFRASGINAIPLDIGREDAIRYGKKYVHNDICFPAQIVIGEVLAALKSGRYDGQDLAVGMGKYIGDCRLTHYSALLRKAMDDAGFRDVPIVTNDDVDYHNLHPGFHLDLMASLRIAVALPMIDVMEELLRKIRPYELVPGSADACFAAGMDDIVEGMSHGIVGTKKGFRKAIDRWLTVKYDRSNPRPTVLIVGEYLLNFHPGANHDIERYLENNGFEIIEARMTDVIRKTYFYQDAQDKEYHLKRGFGQKAWMSVANNFFELAHDITDSVAKKHPLYEKATRMPELVKDSDPIIHHTFDAGEGVLIPGEIIHHAKHGCKAFVILQPFGCLPNHVVGRGIARRLKEMLPDAQILPLDYDPDVSFANIENRLQMLIMNARN